MPGARWQRRDQMHLTLRFIGEVDEARGHDIDDALATVRAPAFTLELAGVGDFGGKDPRALWAGVRANDALIHLEKKVESALQRLGLEAEPRKFTPHVTLARLRNAPVAKVAEFIAHHALFSQRADSRRSFRAVFEPSRQRRLGVSGRKDARLARVTQPSSSISCISSSDSPKWWPISWIRTWRTISPSVSSCSAQ